MHENERRSVFVEDFLSRMRKVRIPYKASVSGILAAHRLTITSLSQLP